MRCVILCVYKAQVLVYFELVLCWQVSNVVTFIGGFTEATGIMDIVLISGALQGMDSISVDIRLNCHKSREIVHYN